MEVASANQRPAEIGVAGQPAAAKGKYLKSITVSSTMGPGVKIDETHVEAASVKK